MKHSDIYEKFLIEYDKANITTSYPSLTEYEIATILDKAYLALIAQKLTGTTSRRVPFEYDSKSVEDVRPLETTVMAKDGDTTEACSGNDHVYEIPDGLMYFVSCRFDNNPVLLINHQLKSNFMETDFNYPWIETPVCFMEGEYIHVLADPEYKGNGNCKVTFIKTPASFVENINVAEGQTFELSPSMAEELISLAIVFATEIVESPRLQTKQSILPLEP